MKIVCANEIGYDPRIQISEVFVDGFYQWLKYFSKDKKILTDAFAHMFNLNVFFVALIDEHISGIAVLSNGTSPTIVLDKSELQKHLGWLRGLFTYKMLKREFMDKKYPFEITSGVAYVEFVATSPAFRGKGIASAIITHFFNFLEYSDFILEVADTNTNAVQLYERLGFKEFMRIEMKNKKVSGVNFLLYMKCHREHNEL